MPISVLNNFTWPRPASHFTFEADAEESGDDLKRRLAAHIGYLALDIVLLRKTGGMVEGVAPLKSQGVLIGETLRIGRKSCLPVGSGVCTVPISPSTPQQHGPTLRAISAAALSPSCATVERFCRSAFALSCVEILPGAPVLLRMLLLDHGYMPHLRARTALQHAIPTVDMQVLLKHMGVVPPPLDDPAADQLKRGGALRAGMRAEGAGAGSVGGKTTPPSLNMSEGDKTDKDDASTTTKGSNESETLVMEAAFAAAASAAAAIISEAPLAPVARAVKVAASAAMHTARTAAVQRAEHAALSAAMGNDPFCGDDEPFDELGLGPLQAVGGGGGGAHLLSMLGGANGLGGNGHTAQLSDLMGMRLDDFQPPSISVAARGGAPLGGQQQGMVLNFTDDDDYFDASLRPVHGRSTAAPMDGAAQAAHEPPGLSALADELSDPYAGGMYAVGAGGSGGFDFASADRQPSSSAIEIDDLFDFVDWADDGSELPIQPPAATSHRQEAYPVFHEDHADLGGVGGLGGGWGMGSGDDSAAAFAAALGEDFGKMLAGGSPSPSKQSKAAAGRQGAGNKRGAASDGSAPSSPNKRMKKAPAPSNPETLGPPPARPSNAGVRGAPGGGGPAVERIMSNGSFATQRDVDEDSQSQSSSQSGGMGGRAGGSVSRRGTDDSDLTQSGAPQPAAQSRFGRTLKGSGIGFGGASSGSLNKRGAGAYDQQSLPGSSASQERSADGGSRSGSEGRDAMMLAPAPRLPLPKLPDLPAAAGDKKVAAAGKSAPALQWMDALPAKAGAGAARPPRNKKK